MRTKLFWLSLLLGIYVDVNAQTSVDRRTNTTKIIDLLATMPAPDKAQLNKSMQQIAQLGNDGIAEMVRMLTQTGRGDNTALEYAIAGYSFYVTQKGKEEERKKAVMAFCSTIGQLSVVHQMFLIQQLQVIGKDDAISCLQRLLKNQSVAGAAARALAQINTIAAEKALLTALQSAKGESQIAFIESLGYAQYKPAVPQVTSIAKSSSGDLRKASLYALARTGDLSSANTLSDAAKKAGYTFDQTEATAAYILYLRQLAANGNKTVAAGLAAKMMQQVPNDIDLHAKTAALKLLIDINQSKSLPLLYAAMKDKDHEYRAAALQFSEPYHSPIVHRELMKIIPSVEKDAKIQILQSLGNTKDKTLYPEFLNFLKNEDRDVRMAAVAGTAKTGQQEALLPLISMLESGDSAEIAIVKNGILRIEGNQVTTLLAGKLDNMPPQAKIAAMEILAARASNNVANDIFKQVSSTDSNVQRAALRALPMVVSTNDLPRLYPLLLNAKAADVFFVRQAIINGAKENKDSIAQVGSVISQMNNAAADKQYLFLDVLASMGGEQALSAVETAYRNGNEQSKRAAISALAASNSKKAAITLLQISRQNVNMADDALSGYLNIISRATFSAEQKLLMLQDAMEITKSAMHRRRIIREVGRAGTFPALMFTGKYLTDATLQQEAANAIMNIALSNKQFNGDQVRDLLTKTIEVMKGPDSDYQREAIRKHLEEMEPGAGFVSLFNGNDLSGWKGLVADPVKRSKMDPATLQAEQQKADKLRDSGWVVKEGLLVFNGHGNNLATVKEYGDFEMYVDWKITTDGDAGIYLRGSPQVQIWDTSRVSSGAQVGSGGLYNNQKNPSKPLVVADNAVGEWNNFRIIMRGERVTVFLNGILVTDNALLENYWDRSRPIFPKEQIELQAHGTYVAYKNIYLKELSPATPFALSDEEKRDGFRVLFDGTNLDEWIGNKTDYQINNGHILVNPQQGSHGNLYTKDEFADFIFRFEFQLTPGANNGLGIRTPTEGDAAYEGMELQILDNDADIYKTLQPYQFHGSVYGVIPAKRGFLKPVGEWNMEEVIVKGSRVKVILNNEVILDGDILEASKNGTIDKHEHPGLLRKSGHIGFLGHGSIVRFRNIRIKELKP